MKGETVLTYAVGIWRDPLALRRAAHERVPGGVDAQAALAGVLQLVTGPHSDVVPEQIGLHQVYECSLVYLARRESAPFHYKHV